MKKSLHCGLGSRQAKGALWHLGNVLRVIKYQWVQSKALCIAGLGTWPSYRFFHLNRNISTVTCCKPGTEHALPHGGSMDWIFKSNTSSSRKFVSTWLCCHGVLKQESIFIQDLVTLFKLLQHFTLPVLPWDMPMPLWFYSFLHAGLWPGPSWGLKTVSVLWSMSQIYVTDLWSILKAVSSFPFSFSKGKFFRQWNN